MTSAEREHAQVSPTNWLAAHGQVWKDQLVNYWDRMHSYLSYIHALCEEAKAEHAALGQRAKRLTADDLEFDFWRMVSSPLGNGYLKLTMTHNQRDRILAEVDPQLRERVMIWAQEALRMEPAVAEEALARMLWMSPWRRLFEEMAAEAEWRRQSSSTGGDPVEAYQQVFHPIMGNTKTPTPPWYRSFISWGQRHLRRSAGYTGETIANS
ncbi:hypothetical protein BX666DRAFT_419747 [Dichotomocladium elegans]|nr:hypothetical protein BX666DRAFT_419747 [Dichotomocladium elegans]